MGLTVEQRESFERDGFCFVRRFAPETVGREMLARVTELSREAKGSGLVGRSLVMPEAKQNPFAKNPEDQVSKVFRLHRDPIFRAFAERPDLLDAVEAILGSELDCFLSQFIFKHPGAMGQPWHQDSYYFPFDRVPQLGVWLAVTEATLENGCLHVLPGSQREPIHAHVPDPRPEANYGYVEIVDHDLSASVPVLMQPGDLLLFHSFLMHRSRTTSQQGYAPRWSTTTHRPEPSTARSRPRGGRAP
jgi:ectoine hydroxylase-related dioxygenase (phytanoyl-CoA dioxygenase family)